VWKILRTSVPGSAHVKAKTPCQDAHSATATSEGVLVVACADGAGSAQRSDEGATAAAAAFVTAASALIHEGRELGQPAVLDCFRAARKAVEERASQIAVPRRELACTLLGAIVGKEEAWFGQIGDGLIVVGDKGEYSPVFWPHAGDYLNDSDFLTDERYEKEVQVAQRKAPGELALTTDGLQLLMANLAAKSIHRGFFAPIFARLRETADENALLAPLQAFLESAAVNARTDDDKTLLLAVRR
jgi:hypothetical protein